MNIGESLAIATLAPEGASHQLRAVERIGALAADTNDKRPFGLALATGVAVLATGLAACSSGESVEAQPQMTESPAPAVQMTESAAPTGKPTPSPSTPRVIGSVSSYISSRFEVGCEGVVPQVQDNGKSVTVTSGNFWTNLLTKHDSRWYAQEGISSFAAVWGRDNKLLGLALEPGINGAQVDLPKDFGFERVEAGFMNFSGKSSPNDIKEAEEEYRNRALKRQNGFPSDSRHIILCGEVSANDLQILA